MSFFFCGCLFFLFVRGADQRGHRRIRNAGIVAHASVSSSSENYMSRSTHLSKRKKRGNVTPAGSEIVAPQVQFTEAMQLWYGGNKSLHTQQT